MESTGLLDKLKSRTGPILQAKRGPVYNHPMTWYAKPDGDIVKLQGDPSNRAYYEDKGYTLLRPDEVREWEKEIRPAVLADARKRSNLIETVRRILASNPGVRGIADFEIMTNEDISNYLGEVGKATGQPVRIIQGKTREAVEPMDDTESSGAMIGSADELLGKIERAEMVGKKGR